MRGKNWYIEYGAVPIVGDMYADDWRELLADVQMSLPFGKVRVYFFNGVEDNACYEMFIPVVPAMSEAYYNRCHQHRFRLLDDDGTVYAYGWSGDDSSFAPLDWAGPTWGCTSIEYWNGDEWEPL